MFLDSSFADYRSAMSDSLRIEMSTGRSRKLQNLQKGKQNDVLLASLSVRLFLLFFIKKKLTLRFKLT